MPDITNLYSGYLKAGRYSRVKSTDLEKALKPYSIKLADVRKNRKASDVSLRRTATKSVVDKYLKAKKSGDSIQPTR